MKGFFTGAIMAFIFTAMIIGSIPLTLLYAKIHLYGRIEDYVDINKARLALISLISKTKNGKSYGDIIVEKLINQEGFDELEIDDLLEKMGFRCYKFYIEEDDLVVVEKKCEEKKLIGAKMKVPLPDLNYKTIVLEVGV